MTQQLVQEIIIVGNAITAEVIGRYLADDPRYNVKAFAVHQDFIKDDALMGIPVVPIETLDRTFSTNTHKAIMAIGYQKLSETRRSVFKEIRASGYDIETYIHPDACIYNDHQIGIGSIILPNTVIEPHVSIGTNSVIWANCTIGHHAKIGDNCWIASGSVVAGQASIGNNCFLGVNTTVSNQITVADYNIIGANTAIHRNTEPDEVYLSRHGEKHRFPARDYAAHLMS